MYIFIINSYKNLVQKFTQAEQDQVHKTCVYASDLSLSVSLSPPVCLVSHESTNTHANAHTRI